MLKKSIRIEIKTSQETSLRRRWHSTRAGRGCLVMSTCQSPATRQPTTCTQSGPRPSSSSCSGIPSKGGWLSSQLPINIWHMYRQHASRRFLRRLLEQQEAIYGRGLWISDCCLCLHVQSSESAEAAGWVSIPRQSVYPPNNSTGPSTGGSPGTHRAP